MAALEDRPGTHGEIFQALIAAVVTGLARAYAITQSAYRAVRALRPQPGFEVFPRAFLIREHLEKLEGAYRYVVIHG
jgi:hypothetical protein